MKRVLALFAIGAIIGTLGDRVHTYTNVLYYPHATFWDEAWWVPPLMGAGGLALLAIQRITRTWLPVVDAIPTNIEIALAAVWFLGSWAASGMFRAYPIALTVFFAASFVGRALGARASRATWLAAVLSALGGTLWEAGLSATGAFIYRQPDFLGVPLWLPALYLHVSLFVGAVDRRWPDLLPTRR